MAAEGSKTEELKADIAVARKRPLAFGLCLGKSVETTVLVTHKTKDPEAMGRQAKKDGETAKIAFGMMSVEGKNLNLSCEKEPPAGLARKTKEMLKAAGVKFKVRILDAEGNLLEEDGDDDEGEEELIAEAAESGEVPEPEPASGDAPVEENPERDAWRELAVKLQPRIEALKSATTPDAKKAVAFWEFAIGKAEGSDADYAGALKAAKMIEKLLGADTAVAGNADSAEEDDAKLQKKMGRALDALEAELRLLNRAVA